MCTSWPRAASPRAIGSMNVPTVSPGNRGYDVATITTRWGVTGGSRRAIAGGARQGVSTDSSSTPPDSFDEPMPPLDEDDRHFADARAARVRFVDHLDEKRVAVGHDAVERQLRQRLAAPAAEAAGAVVGAQPGDGTDVAVGERAEDDALQRPVDHADAVQVARPDDDVVRSRRPPPCRAGTSGRATSRRPSGRSGRPCPAPARAAGRRRTTGRDRACRCGAATSTRPGNSRASSSAIAPVPSGDPSSTTITRRRDSAAPRGPVPAGCRARCTSG